MKTYKNCPCHRHGRKGIFGLFSRPCTAHFHLSFPHGNPCEICGYKMEMKDEKPQPKDMHK